MNRKQYEKERMVVVVVVVGCQKEYTQLGKSRIGKVSETQLRGTQ